ncbi:MAG: ATP-binding cassette domain-containing protein [Candidatus Portnoybacteria bacterium]|nr:ATP-binding cassette domain-containing protein [Candidatus Portnoybacteria bacterium]
MDSFVKVSHAFVEYGSAASLFSRLSGRQSQKISVLRDITLHINQGSHITVFGKAGVGKSSLLRLLTGAVKPTQGIVSVNGKAPFLNPQAAAWYVSSEENESTPDTPLEALNAFIKTHNIQNGSARLAEVVHSLHMADVLQRPTKGLSSTERLKVNLARAFISDAPVILLDDVADELGVEQVQRLLDIHGSGRTVVIATRFPQTAETLELPIVLLHNGALAHYGTCEDIATSVACPRLLDAWVEGLRYDILQKIRKHPGTLEVRLLPTDQFSGQRLRIMLNSSHYLPSMYDLLSQTELVRVQEVPPSLVEILEKL